MKSETSVEIPTESVITNIAGGLAGRLRSLVLHLDRLDRLESGSGQWQTAFESAELPEAATELTLRALSIVAERANFTLLQALVSDESCSMKRLIQTTGWGRLVLSERLNDLIQVGLATRMIDTDHAQITVAGANAVTLVEALRIEVARQYKNNNGRSAEWR